MQDKELYQQILGLTSPWTVSEVKLDMPSQEIRVRVEHPRGTMFCCPECKKQLSCYDHGEERQWRHLDSCQFKTILIGRVPRVECPEHGVKSVAVPWAEPHSRFTIMFERFGYPGWGGDLETGDSGRGLTRVRAPLGLLLSDGTSSNPFFKVVSQPDSYSPSNSPANRESCKGRHRKDLQLNNVSRHAGGCDPGGIL